MKKISILLSVLTLLIGFSSCEDVLDIDNTKELSDAAIWSSEKSADLYVTASYKTFTDASQVFSSRSDYYDSYSDLMKSTSWDQYNHSYNKALLQASSFSKGNAGSLGKWEDIYTRIRRANVLLVEIDRYGTKYGEDWCNIRRAEARLCRAYSYYRLIRVYGGVIIRTDKSGASGGVDDGVYEEDKNRARATEAESWDFVLSELQWAAEYLPEEWPNAWDGRATKKTAYGLLSRIALYAKKWQLAADAAEKVEELGGDLAKTYSGLFNVGQKQDNSSEILFALYGLSEKVTHRYDLLNRPYGDKSVYSTDVYAEHVPTAELADLYEFSDGTAFDWNTYSSKYADPYTDREPRFHTTILYNGAKWENRTIQTYIGGTDEFEAFKTVGSTNGHTCTGYYLRKYLQEGHSDFVTKQSYQYDAVLRYAEVLLNKAEAYAQLDYAQHMGKALAALNKVRNRVGLPNKESSDAASLDAFMVLLRKERSVELAGEGLRYWDLRRWKLAENVLNGKMAHGTKIVKNADGTFTYAKVDCDANTSRVFLPNYYYFSLPSAEIGNNKLCEDNPGW